MEEYTMLTLFPEVIIAKFSSGSFSSKEAKYISQWSEIYKAGVKTIPFLIRKKEYVREECIVIMVG